MCRKHVNSESSPIAKISLCVCAYSPQPEITWGQTFLILNMLESNAQLANPLSHSAHVGIKGQMVEASSFLLPCGPRNSTLVTGVGSKHLFTYWVSHCPHQNVIWGAPVNTVRFRPVFMSGSYSFLCNNLLGIYTVLSLFIHSVIDIVINSLSWLLWILLQ